jgi:hypothetical protein
MISAEDIKYNEVVREQQVATRLSGIVNTSGAETAIVIVKRGKLSTSGVKAYLKHSDTATNLYSSMTASLGIASAVASGSSICWIVHKPKKMLGILLSARTTASGVAGATVILTDNKTVPVSSTLGFTTVARIPSGA